MSKKQDDIKSFSVPNLTPNKDQQKEMSNNEFRKMLLNVLEAFAAAGKPVVDITLLDGDREVKMTPQFIKQEPS